MKLFFDILLYISCAAAIIILVTELMRLPVRAEKIASAENGEKKTAERYMKNAFVLLEIRILIAVLSCFAVAVISYCLGSAPRKFENPSLILVIPASVLVVGTAAGGIVLGRYFSKVAIKNNIWVESNNPKKTYIRMQFVIGLIIAFLGFLIISYALTHLFFVLNLT